MSEQFDIQVKVDNFYLGAQSDPAENRFVFAYTITIENFSKEAVSLLKRYWLITDANGKQAEVYGDGVVGEQPELAPGSSYSYTSGAVLETPVGTMQGHYEMISHSEQRFNAAIPVFRLAMPNILN
ncbi:Co2+/Mg2+ efflux protein ApaG [Arsukibacterium sp. UBA3155]|mgnify:FL=1|uniref:Co2+/Mg2+ efflux protein ApaG n=1 Tax=Arsukibacterium sp. UBA3155 TaxID=1946058 RepID=UPI0025B824CF|nr:Co2+/Mg2+ efflux protein ApaG [Arsukibacterium sp. UBA3155]|tara:strand:- start:10300 stop:10677 length:378 start_codon:yes stop_codon:yes gene_type:complete